MNQKIFSKQLFLPTSVRMAMIVMIVVFLLQMPVWAQEPLPYPPSDNRVRALQIVSEKLNLPMDSLWIANYGDRHFVYLNQDVRIVEVRSENRDILEIVFDSKGKLLSFDSREFYDLDPAIKNLRQVLSEKLDVPINSLRVLGDEIKHSPYTDRDIRSVHIFDDFHEKSQYIAMDKQGDILSFDALTEITNQERMAKEARYGKLDPPLYEELQTLGPDDTIKVVIMIKKPAGMVTDIPSPTDEEYETKGLDVIEQERLANIRDRDARVRTFLEPFRQKIEAMKGAKVLYVGTSLTIDAEVTREQVEAIEKWEEVREIYKMSTGGKGMLDVSVPSVKAPSAWSQGFIGNGTQIGVIEKGGIDLNNPFLVGVNRLNDCAGVESSTLENYHATKVAGVIASVHNTYKGVAYEASLLEGTSCSYSEADVRAAIDWAIDNGAKVINSSWGQNSFGVPDAISRYYDQKVIENKVFIASASGNCDDNYGNYQCSVISPAIAYNVMAVGGYDDHNNTNLADDTMYRFSSYIDTISGAGKPEIVAPAVAIKTTDEYDSFEDALTPGLGVTGTSAAAPHVAAAAELLIQGNSVLADKPEAIKAILMASAIHNIDGNSEFSDKDGAGALDIDRAISVAKKQGNNGWISEVISPSSFTNRHGGTTPEKRYAIYPKSNRRVRIVLTWAVDPDYANYNTKPGAGLWFEVEKTDSYGTPVTYLCDPCGLDGMKRAGSMSIFEFITPTLPVGVHYFVTIKYDWFDDTSTRIGLAWSVSLPDDTEMAEHKDTDGDGMPDNYETFYGLNPNADDSDPNYIYRDKDGDGLTNLTEFDLGTPPNQINNFFTNFPLVLQQSIVKAQDIYELRDAVNAMRASKNLPPISWSNPRIKGRLINAIDVEGLRSGLTPALQARGFSVPSWVDPSLSGKVIKAEHLNQIRNAVK